MFRELFTYCPHILDIMRWSKEIGVRWADEILARNTISAPAAMSGEPLDASGIISTSSRTTFLEFDEPGQQPYCLVASRVGIGYQIASIYFYEIGFLFNWEDQKFGFGRSAVDNYRTLKLQRANHRIAVKPLEEGVCLFLGHENFAHHLLNELTGVWRAKEAGLLNRVQKIFAQYEPLGPVTDLIPDLASVPRQTVKINDNGRILAENNILMIGGVRISASLRDMMRTKITEMASKLYPQEIDTVMSTPGHRVSLAVRTHSRVVDNNNKMIVDICDRLKDRVGAITPILDGFSLPHDLRANPNYTPWFTEKGNLSQAQVNEITWHFRQAGYETVLNTANKDVVLALWMSMQTSFYFSNQGTQQHKAGWLSDASGVVHFPPSTLDQPGSIGWFKGMNEASPQFKILPKEFVKSFNDSTDRASAGYMFQDVEKAADWVANALTESPVSDAAVLAAG